MSETILSFYRSHGVMSDPGPFAAALDNTPDGLGDLVQIVQANLVHVFWAERYGLRLVEEQKASLNQRSMVEKLGELDKRGLLPLGGGHSLKERQVGNCRDFSLFLCSLLRTKGIPARARCGFGTYFLPDHYEDHWICEMWDADRGRWVMVDAQLDSFQIKALGVEFDPFDVPQESFITGGRAWQMCRSGESDPESFGIFDMRGWWFIWGNVVRDFLALNKVEILPWDGGWGYLRNPLDAPLPEDEVVLEFYDHVAALTVAADERFVEIRGVYGEDQNWRLPDELLAGLLERG